MVWFCLTIPNDVLNRISLTLSPCFLLHPCVRKTSFSIFSSKSIDYFLVYCYFLNWNSPCLVYHWTIIWDLSLDTQTNFGSTSCILLIAQRGDETEQVNAFSSFLSLCTQTTLWCEDSICSWMKIKLTYLEQHMH